MLDGCSPRQLRPRRNLPFGSILEELFSVYFLLCKREWSRVLLAGTLCCVLSTTAKPQCLCSAQSLLTSSCGYFLLFNSCGFQSFSVGILCYMLCFMLKTCFVVQIYGLNVLWSLLKQTPIKCLLGCERLDQSCVPLALLISSFLLVWAKGRALHPVTCGVRDKDKIQGCQLFSMLCIPLLKVFSCAEQSQFPRQIMKKKKIFKVS